MSKVLQWLGSWKLLAMNCASIRLCRLLILLMAAAASGFYFGCYWVAASDTTIPQEVCDEQSDDIDFKRHNAQQLEEIALQLKGGCVDRRLQLALQQVIAQLDPRSALSGDDLLRDEARAAAADTCGEEYKGAHFGSPFYREGFVRAKACRPEKKPALSDLVTAVLLAPEGTAAALSPDLPLRELRELHPRLPAVVAVTRGVAPHKKTTVVTVRARDYAAPGALLNRLVAKARTPYVLVARDAVRVDELARVERLVHVVSALGGDGGGGGGGRENGSGWGVAVAGGALRDPDGRWSAGCLQTELRNYALRVRRGYRYSALDCMLCDQLSGPFIARTSLMREIPFHEKLSSAVVFEDWFLRVKRRGALAAACPDSLFFVSGAAESEGVGASEGDRRAAWRELARTWRVDRLLLPGRAPLRFSCSEVGLSCGIQELHEKGMLIPSCCLAQVARAFAAFEEFAARHAFEYELNEGTALGAVKLRSFLPWDIDGDIIIKCEDFLSYKDKQEEIKALGYLFNGYTEKDPFKYFFFRTPDVTVDMWCRNKLSTFLLPKEMQTVPTRVRMMNLWMRGPWNPGLLIRNRYGPGYLKHAQHWRKLRMKDSMAEYSVGSWGNCSIPNHHACLNRYPTEGSFNLLPEDCPYG